jgi:predicted small integral membrane protein
MRMNLFERTTVRPNSLGVYNCDPGKYLFVEILLLAWIFVAWFVLASSPEAWGLVLWGVGYPTPRRSAIMDHN